MSELRWIIAAIAALVIIGFYVSARVRRAQDDHRFWADNELPDPDSVNAAASVNKVTRTGGPDGTLKFRFRAKENAILWTRGP